VFYYGKNFESMRQKLNRKGELEEKYKPLSVTKAGPEPEEDAFTAYLNQHHGAENVTMDDILGILGANK
jgi:hypothetical protein